MRNFALLLILLFQFSLYPEITLSFVGDVMTGSDHPDKSYLPPNEGKDVFKSVSSFLKASDISFANLEGAIANSETKSAKTGKRSYSFRMPPYMADRRAILENMAQQIKGIGDVTVDEWLAIVELAYAEQHTK